MMKIDRLAATLTGMFYFDDVRITVESMCQMSLFVGERVHLSTEMLIKLIDIAKEFGAEIELGGAPTWGVEETGVEFSFALSLSDVPLDKRR
jgi:hypothetical protein